MQPRGQHPGVVEDEQVALAQQRGQIGEVPIDNRARVTVKMKQPAVAAPFTGIARDQLVGKVVRELAAQHRQRMLAEPRGTKSGSEPGIRAYPTPGSSLAARFRTPGGGSNLLVVGRRRHG
jgi:hypothetical protein